jgi:hypothetical protein
VVNLDLQDFFPAIGYRRVKGLFRAFGYSEAEACIIIAAVPPTLNPAESPDGISRTEPARSRTATPLTRARRGSWHTTGTQKHLGATER